jgi:16S rRNA (adenine1518-N6/adenine1519-N6)-dimethyltransferase
MGILEKLKSNGFSFSKGLGQNFILDQGFLRSVVAELNLSKDETVVEVGTGAGTLTQVLARSARRVVTFEIDQRLKGILSEQFVDFDNIELHFADALKTDIDKIINQPYTIVANIPYYITTPLIQKFLASPNCQRICVLVQDDVAYRITAKVGSSEYGSLSVMVQSAGNARIMKKVSRAVFVPAPKVDSAFVLIEKGASVSSTGNADMEKLLKGMFSARRKTAVNALMNALGLSREVAADLLTRAGVSLDMRPQNITPQQYQLLANLTKQDIFD